MPSSSTSASRSNVMPSRRITPRHRLFGGSVTEITRGSPRASNAQSSQADAASVAYPFPQCGYASRQATSTSPGNESM